MLQTLPARISVTVVLSSFVKLVPLLVHISDWSDLDWKDPGLTYQVHNSFRVTAYSEC